MLHAKDSQEIVLSEGALTIEIEADRPIVSIFKGVGLNLAMIPSEVLHLLQDGVLTELRAHEQ